MAIQKPTPEEKLFAVIQGAKHPSPRVRTRALSLAALSTQMRAVASAMELPRVNEVLLGLIVIVGLWGVVNPFVLRPRVDRLLSQVTQQIEPFLIVPPLEGLRSAQDYVQAMTTQDPFRVGEPSPGTQLSPRSIQTPTQTAQALLADLRLVGISHGEKPVAMIEQVSSRQTHFLNVGEVIGQLTIKEILDDRVVLQYGSQTLELY